MIIYCSPLWMCLLLKILIALQHNLVTQCLEFPVSAANQSESCAGCVLPAEGLEGLGFLCHCDSCACMIKSGCLCDYCLWHR